MIVVKFGQALSENLNIHEEIRPPICLQINPRL